MSPVIRVGGHDDAHALSNIGRDSFVETFGHLYKAEDLSSFLDSAHTISAYERILADPQSCAWLVELDGEVVGYASVGPCDLPVPQMPAKSGELQRLYLLAKSQGAGTGTALLEHALAFLGEHFDHQFVSVYAENTGAQKLYRRYGFEKIHDYFFMVGTHRDPEWVMKRR